MSFESHCILVGSITQLAHALLCLDKVAKGIVWVQIPQGNGKWSTQLILEYELIVYNGGKLGWQLG